MKRKLGPNEAQLHLSVAHLLDWLLLSPAIYTTIPSGWGVLSPSMAQRLKKSGLKAGMPDVMVWYDGHSFGIELKARGNTLDPVQVQRHAELRAAGVPVYVCRSLDDVMDVLLHEHVPLREIAGYDGWDREHKEPLHAEIYAKRVVNIGAAGDADGTG